MSAKVPKLIIKSVLLCKYISFYKDKNVKATRNYINTDYIIKMLAQTIIVSFNDMYFRLNKAHKPLLTVLPGKLVEYNEA